MLYSQSDFVNQTVAYFTSKWNNTGQEKLYLHTDKPYYSAGDTIWFKAYLSNAATHLPNAKSNFVYVELINAFDTVMHRVKIRRDSLGFSGNINLSPEIPEGDYILRAYTYWMQNVGSDFFFHKQVKIGNPIDDRLFAKINFGEISNGFRAISIALHDVNAKPLIGIPVNLSAKGFNNTIKSLASKSNNLGELYWQIPHDSTSKAKKQIILDLKDSYLKTTKQFRVPPIENDFDVQFFPESGALINENIQTIAFKAIGANGLSVNVSGHVFDANGEEVAQISTLYKGMGKFWLYAEAGKAYYAILKTNDGFSKKFHLPEVVDQGVALKINVQGSKIIYDINNRLTPDFSKLYLMIHVRGFVLALQQLKAARGQISVEQLPAGITSFSVVDSLGNVFAERLYFIKNKPAYQITATSDKPAYKMREKISLLFNVADFNDEPLTGNFSLSVTDAKTVVPDAAADNIETWYMLSSDIKGYVEGPADYFVDDTIASQEKLDLLMLTQAWRRFDLSQYLKQETKKPAYYLEIGQAITGKVLNIFNKPTPNCNVIMLFNENRALRMTQTDANGQFVFDGIQFADSSAMLLKAQKNRSITDVEIVPDVDVFPSTSVFVPFRNEKNDEKFARYWQVAKDKYYMEGGMRVINLDELTVTASAKPSESETSFYLGADNVITADKLNQHPGMNIMAYLQMQSGVNVTGENISIRGSAGAPLILIDGFEIDSTENISYLTTNDLESIEIFKGASASVFGSLGGNGAIVLTLKKGVGLRNATPISMSVIKPLGFQKPSVFYMPKYEVEAVSNRTTPDLRTTIFWADKLRSDSDGKIVVSFYAADPPNNYNYVLEGITDTGELIHKAGVIKRQETLPHTYY